jgi:phosphoglycerate kinase
MIKDYLSMDDFKVKGKTVLLRIDINSQVIDGKVIMSDKIEEHAKTIKELSEKKAKTVVLSHQGRAGGKDFISLEQHAELLRNFIPAIKYIDDIIGPAARESIEEMEEGEVLLLENVRMLAEETLNRSPEEHARSIFVRKLAPFADIYINDAFETAHRSHASLVGFPMVLPSGIGRVMERDLGSLEGVIQGINRPCVHVLGGAKLDDAFALVEHLLEKDKADYILTTGNIANLFLCVKGFLDKSFFDEKYIEWGKRILEQDKEKRKIKLPKDVAVAVDVEGESKSERKEILVEEITLQQPVYDIGMQTCEEYSSLLKEAKTIVMKGPAGVYEREGFIKGTRVMFEAISSSKAFSLVGGGDTTSALKMLGMEKEKFSAVSLAGGALLRYLSGEKLPALEVLKRKT